MIWLDNMTALMPALCLTTAAAAQPALVCHFPELCIQGACEELSPLMTIVAEGGIDGPAVYFIPEGLAPDLDRMPDELVAPLYDVAEHRTAGRVPYGGALSSIDPETGVSSQLFGIYAPAQTWAHLTIATDGPQFDSVYALTEWSWRSWVFGERTRVWRGICEREAA